MAPKTGCVGQEGEGRRAMIKYESTVLFLPTYWFFLVTHISSSFLSRSLHSVLTLALLFLQTGGFPRHNTKRKILFLGFVPAFLAATRVIPQTYPHPRHTQLCVHWTMAIFSRIGKGNYFQNVLIPEPFNSWLHHGGWGAEQASSGENFHIPALKPVFIHLLKSDLD